MGINEILINKVKILNNSFGVYSAEVIPPSADTCSKNDKQFKKDIKI